MNAVKHLFDTIILILIIFIVPLIWVTQKADIAMQTYVYSLTNDFVKTIEKDGYLTKEMYENYLKNLNDTGIIYQVEIEHKQHIYEPEYISKVFTGKVMEYTDIKYTKEIISELYDSQQGKYYFDLNDNITVKIRSISDSVGMGIAKFLYRSAPVIAAEKSGIIRDLQMR